MAGRPITPRTPSHCKPPIPPIGHFKLTESMAKGKKRDSDEYEEDEEDEDDDMEEDDYVPSPRDRKSGSQAKSKTGSIEPSMEPVAGDRGGAAAAGEAEPQLVLIEELWVTCDRCDKWRLLPPGSIKPSENIPW